MQLKKIEEIKDKNLLSLMEELFEIDFCSLRLQSRYYDEYHDNFEDLSFCVFSDDFSSIILFLVYRINNTLTLDEAGAKIFIRDGACKNSLGITLNHVDSIFNHDHIKSLYISDYLQNGNLSKLGNALLGRGYTSKIIFDMSVSSAEYDLPLYHSSIRKSYKSLINWGKKNISINYINKQNLNKKTFDDFRCFHSKISNKVTRSVASWDIQYDMISHGCGELSMGYKDGVLVTGILVLRHFNKLFYAVGVHERDLFDFGLSHYIIYDAISRNLSKPCTPPFLLGYYDTMTEDKKISSINFFKKGFSPKVEPLIIWHKENS